MNIVTESLRAESAPTERLLASLQDSIGTQKFNAWFKHGTQVSLEEGYVKVTVPNPFVAGWIETHFQTQISNAAANEIGAALPVMVTVDPSLSSNLRRTQLDSQAVQVARANDGSQRPRQAAPQHTLKYDMTEFIVGESNKLAYSAALAVASTAKAPFNPLFIHGPCGVGKTHLLQGICSRVSKLKKDGRPISWRYVSAEQFTNEFIVALRAKKLDDFRARYRSLDLLAIDDVHFLSAKKATQDEFLHTFNTLQSAGNQIVMASDAHPKMVNELNAQLVSRFIAGMVVKIDAPEHFTRIEILRRRCSSMTLHVPDEVLEYIASHIHGSVRELEGALVKLTALAALENGRISLQLAIAGLADHLARTDSAVTLGDIESVVATFFGVSPADIHSSRRTKTVSIARMLSMFLARRNTRMSYPEIGRFMGKNHSSVVLAVQRMESLLKQRGELSWMTPAGEKTMPASQVLELVGEEIC